MTKDDDSATLDVVLDALANPHRRDIVYVLGLQPCAINQLAQMRGLSLPAIHKHITVLERAGLIIRHKRGRTSYLTLNRRALQELQTWIGQFQPHWGSDEATYGNYDQYLGITRAQPPSEPSTTGEDPT